MTEAERLIKLETKMDNIENKVDKLTDTLEKFIDKAEERFASKWVETTIKAGIGFVLLTVLGALIYLVIKH